MEETINIFTPTLQYGFAGFSLLLTAIIVWLIRRLLAVLDANNQIIADNTSAIRDIATTTSDEMRLVRSLHDKILARPCIAGEERKMV